jgi:hypothetical protein
MRNMTARLLFAAAAAAITLFAAEGWKKHEFTQWSQDDVDRILNDSPWAKETLATFEAPHSHSAGGSDESEGGTSIGYTAPSPINNGMPAGPGRSPDSAAAGPIDAAAASMPTIRVVVRWESALPVKEALLRLKFGAHPPAPGDAGYTLDRVEKDYVLAVVGLTLPSSRKKPAPGEESPQDRMRDELLATTTLTPKGRQPILPEEVRVNPPEARSEVLILFPRTQPIEASDKEVTFDAQWRLLGMRKSFRLKDMMYRGKLEL